MRLYLLPVIFAYLSLLFLVLYKKDKKIFKTLFFISLCLFFVSLIVWGVLRNF